MRRYRQRPVAMVVLSVAAAAVAAFIGVSPAQAAPAEGTIRGDDAPGTIKDNYIVVFKSGSAESRAVDSAAGNLSRRYGGQVRHSYRDAVHGFSARLTEKGARQLAADPSIDYVEQDRTVSVDQANPPSWGLDRIDQNILPLNAKYTYPNTASNVTAYVIDTGVRITHRDFGGRARNGYDFVDNDAVAEDCAGHGTHVAGTIGGTASGVAKQVKLVAVRVMNCQGTGTYAQILAGLDWVTRNAVKPAVANLSLGGAANSTLDSAVKASIASGITYAVSAGNDNLTACDQSPARLAEAITVGSTDILDRRSTFSNYGTCVDVFAPGTSITSDYNTSDTAMATMSGTSMAAPHVAGAAAIILSANPTATPARVRDIVVTTALPVVTNPGTGSPNKLLREGITQITVPPTSPAAPGCALVGSGTNLTIPDLGTVDSKISITCLGKASATSVVAVDIKYTYAGDLALSLVAPDGSSYPLRAADQRLAVANIVARYTVNLSTENRVGVWRLRVVDTHRGHVGFVDSWSLTV